MDTPDEVARYFAKSWKTEYARQRYNSRSRGLIDVIDGVIWVAWWDEERSC